MKHEEIKDLIEKEDYDKYKKLLQEFECKAIDTIENLTWQFKEELAEEIDDKIKGWKKESERLLKENWVKDDKIKKLEQELAELKEKLSKATQFETPHIERFALVRYLAQKNKPYKIVNCYDCYRDKEYKIHYCFYNVKSMNFKLIEVFTTEQEAQAKLKEIQGNE